MNTLTDSCSEPEKVGFIDKTGAFVLTAPLDRNGDPLWEPFIVENGGTIFVKGFSEGLAVVRKKIISTPGVLLDRFYYIDKAGRQAIPQTFFEADQFSEGVAFVRPESALGNFRTCANAIDAQGKIIFKMPGRCEGLMTGPDFSSSFSGLAKLEVADGGWAYIDKKGKIVWQTH